MSEKTSPVVVIGDAFIDEIHDDQGVRAFVGGAGLNVAVGLSVLGVPATLVCSLGDANEEGAKMIRAHLAHYGVGVIASISPLGTGYAVSERVNGEPHYVFSEAAYNRVIEYGPEAIAAIEAAPAVAISCFRFDDDEQAAAIERLVARPGERLIIDPNPRAGMLHSAENFARNFERVASHALLVKIGDDDGRLLYGEEPPAVRTRLLAAGVTRILETAGARGATIVDESGTELHVPIAELPGPIVDTMGAGDSTLATVTAGIATNGIPVGTSGWHALLSRAMLVAAATCRNEGALLRLPVE
jgi:fructokinase